MFRSCVSFLAFVYVIISCTCCQCTSCINDNLNFSLPEYYIDYLDGVIREIETLKKDQSDGFFFWTDTHYPENSTYAPSIINYIQNRTGRCFVFNGGDVAKNADNLKVGLDINTSTFEAVVQNGLFFPIRGNHDYTSSTARNVEFPETFDDKQVHDYLASYRSDLSVINSDDPFSNYYYVDSPEAGIRYIVFDTTDSVENDRIVYGISEAQLQWIFERAVHTLPDGWSIVFFSHVPLGPDHTSVMSINEAASRVLHTSSSRNVLFCLSGHRHSDMETGIGDVFQILTEADCLEDTGRTRTPYSFDPGMKIPGTVNEQTIDYVSISKDHSTVTMKRIGHGYDRIFNICPLEIPVGASIRLKSGYDGPVTWFVYDADGCKVGRYDENRFRSMNTSHKYAEISESGELRNISAGNSIAVATYPDGTKEYFMIKSR